MTGIAAVPAHIGPVDGALSFVDLPPLELLDRIEFYAPFYMGPAASLEIMSRMPRLRVCQLLTAGFEQALDVLPDGVTLCNAVGVHDASTAELAVGLAIAKLRGLDDFARAMERGAWLHERRDALADRVVVVVGSGQVGEAIRRRLEPFEVEIRMVGRTSRPGVHGARELRHLIADAEVVILAVPLTDMTRRLVDDDFLAELPDGALVVNVARGPVVDTDAVLRHAHRLRFALDVTDPEPLPADHPLWREANVLISPHVGGNTSAFRPRVHALVSDQVSRWRGGRPLLGRVAVGAVQL